MGNVASISNLYNELSGEVSGTAPDNTLIITMTTVENANIQQFIQTLPKSQLVLNDITLTQQIESFPQTLSVSGNTAENWPISGINNGVIRSIVVTILFTQTTEGAVINAVLSATGNLQISSQSLGVTGTLQSDNSLQFSLQQAGSSSLSLSDIANYASNGRMNSYLPAGVVLFDFMPVSAIDLSFGFVPTFQTSFGVTASTGSSWVIVPNSIEIQQVGITVTSSYWMQTLPSFQSAFSGAIYGIFNLGIDFQILLYFQTGNIWELAILPADGDVLPTLDALTNLIGGQSLQNAVDAGLSALGIDGIAITGVHIGFNYVNLSLTYIRIEGSIDFFEALINVYVSVSNAYPKGNLPSFTFGGTLAEGSELSIKYMAQTCFNASDNFPDVNVIEFSMAASPVDEAYQLSMALEDREFHIGPVYLNQFSFDISYNNGIFAGGIMAAIHIGNTPQLDENSGNGLGDHSGQGLSEDINQDFGIDVTVSASSEDVTSGAWIFEGKTAEGQIIPIGEFIDYMGSLFGIQLPSYFSQITLQDILIQFNTGTCDFHFAITGHFPLGDQLATMNVNVSVINQGETYRKELTGELLIGTAAFNLIFSSDDAATSFSATYVDRGNPLTIEELFAAAGFDVGETIPESLNLAFTQAGFVYDTANSTFVLSGTVQNALPDGGVSNNFGTAVFLTDQPTTPPNSLRRYIFGVDVSVEINLSNLPLVGQEFSTKQTLSIQNLQVFVSSTALTAQEATQLNLDISKTKTAFTLPAQGVSAGINFSGDMNLGGMTTSVSTAIVTTPLPSSAPESDPVLPALPDSTHWITLQKSFGPVTFKRVGVLYQNEQIFFKLDASLAFGGLGLSLDGLSVSSPLTDFEPGFHLDGLGVSFVEGPLEIAGAFLNVPVDQSKCSVPGDCYEYDGGVTIMFEGFGFAAVGSYAKLGSFASMFVFGEIDAPLGGIPAFFITGLSGGFGYNSHLRIPDLNEVYLFPFVAGLSNPDVLGGQGGKPPTPLDVLDVLQRPVGNTRAWVTQKAGEDWLALGISFTSYELVNSRALLVAEFGQTFEFSMLGLATMQLPKGLAENSPEVFGYVELQLEAVFVPADGFIGISAVLSPNSYLLDKSCHPTGGFALYMWLSGSHAGDFALTIGGYHPAFTKPAWYPTVPKVGFNWPISKEITIKGEAYCALTPAMIMAGGLLNANYQDGDLKAWFTANADFLIGWQPFYYQASIGVSVGASYKISVWKFSKTVSAEIGATLELWGPATGGTVSVHWSVISFTVSFGASKNIRSTPLTWNQFAVDSAQKLLPDTDSILTLAAQEGLLLIDQNDEQQPHNPAWIVRPAGFSFVTNSAIPASSLQVVNHNASWTAPASTSGINIRPMSKTGVSSTLSIEITLDDQPLDMTGWTIVAKQTNVPTALWGAPVANATNKKSSVAALANQTAHNPNEAATIQNQFVGFNVTGKTPRLNGSTNPIEISSLGYEPVANAQTMPLSPSAQPVSTAAPNQEDDMILQIMQTVNAGSVAQARTNIFNALQTLYNQISDSQGVPNTNGALPNLASEAGSIYTDAPLAPPAPGH